MDPDQLKKLERRLRALHGDMREDLEEHKQELREEIPQDFEDAACVREEADIIEEASEIEEKKLRLIEGAFQRIADGTYGKCLECGGDINVERLKLVPYAEYCIECQGKKEEQDNE